MKLLSTSPLITLLAIFLLVCTGCSRKTEIITGIDERQANNIISFLAEQGIPAEKTPQSQTGGGANQQQMWNISVPKDQATEALIILSRNGLPRRQVQNILDVFQKSGLVSSDTEEMIRYQQALGEQIAGTIEQIDGILQAVVQISFPPPSQTQALGTETERAPVRASVYVKHQGVLDNPNSQLISKIQRLVAASVTGLDYRNVTVVPDRARFADVVLEPEGGRIPDEISDYAVVWGMVVGKNSVGRLQAIFFTLCILLLLLALALLWILWKFFPALQQSGGFRGLLTTSRPFAPPAKSEEEEEEEEEEEL